MLLLPLTMLPATATFRLATCVVLVTVNGAVPVVTTDKNVEPLKVPYVPLNTPAVSVPSE